MRTLEARFKIIRNGADYGELYATGSPQLRMNDSSAIKMSLSGDFAKDDSFDFLTDRIRPELVIDGEVFPIGIYLPATVQESENENTRAVHIEAYDQCWLVQDVKTEDYVLFTAGQNYIDVIMSLLTECGIALVVSHGTDAVLTEDRQDWDIGTSYLEIVNQLLSEINYNPLWFDNNGYAVLELASIPTAANIEHELDNTNVKSLLMPSIKRQTDIYKSPNVFVCICSNADKDAPMVARAENTNPQSPLSIPRRGRRIVSVINVDNISSQEELQAYANRLVYESITTGEQIQVETALLPGYGVSDVIALHYGDIVALTVEHSWSMSLDTGGRMIHTLEKVVLNIE